MIADEIYASVEGICEGGKQYPLPGVGPQENVDKRTGSVGTEEQRIDYLDQAPPRLHLFHGYSIHRGLPGEWRGR